MFCRTTDGGAIDDFEVDTDTEDAGYSHSHFPSVAVSSVELGSFGGEVWQFTMVMVVWRSYIPDPDPRDEADTDGWENYFSSIRGRVYIYSSGSLLGGLGPVRRGLARTEGGVYASDPSVVGLADGTFLIAFTAQSSTVSERGSVRTRTYSWPSGTLGEGGTLGEISVVEEPDPDTGTGPTGTFPHKFPSLATNAAKDRVLMAYEVGTSGAQESHGTRMAAMHVADPTLWTIMPMTDGDGDGECDPTEDESTDAVDLVGDLGTYLQVADQETATPQQTINPCVVIRASGNDTDFVGFVFRDNLESPARTRRMSLAVSRRQVGAARACSPVARRVAAEEKPSVTRRLLDPSCDPPGHRKGAPHPHSVSNCVVPCPSSEARRTSV